MAGCPMFVEISVDILLRQRIDFSEAPNLVEKEKSRAPHAAKAAGYQSLHGT